MPEAYSVIVHGPLASVPDRTRIVSSGTDHNNADPASSYEPGTKTDIGAQP